MKKFGFGLMRLPLTNGEDPTSIDLERVKGMADSFMEQGFTYFDTAAPYHKGASEVAFREAVVKRYPREAYTITDKLSLFMINEAEEIPAFFDKQLEQLGVEYLDYYLVHALGRDSYRKAQEMKAFEFAAQKKAEGKIRHVGFSFHDSAEVLEQILTEHPEVEYVQLQINYLDWEDENVQSRKCYEVAAKHGKPVIVMEPVKGGALANVLPSVEQLLRSYAPEASVASWAVRYAASFDNVMMVLSGMSNEEQVADNLSYMREFQPLNAEEQAILVQAAEKIRFGITVPCTACRYCVDDCPMKIAIPDYFSILNDWKRSEGKDTENAKAMYKELTNSHGKASECVECGMCEEHCPQHIKIRKQLVAVAQALE